MAEVHRLLEEGFLCPKYRAFFMILYRAGLRISEACHLKVEHIDSGRIVPVSRQRPRLRAAHRDGSPYHNSMAVGPG